MTNSVLDLIEDCFRPEIQIVSGLSESEIETEIGRLNEFNRSLDAFLYGSGQEEDFVEQVREILGEPLDEYIKVANENLKWLG